MLALYGKAVRGSVPAVRGNYISASRCIWPRSASRIDKALPPGNQDKDLRKDRSMSLTQVKRYGIAAVTGGVVSVLAVPIVLRLLGVSPAGIVAGSVIAWMQSVAMAGLGTIGTVAFGTAGAAAGVGVLHRWSAAKHSRRDQSRYGDDKSSKQD